MNSTEGKKRRPVAPRSAHDSASPRRHRARALKPRLSREAEAALTPRQFEVLDTLEGWVLGGEFADSTMAEIARTMGCSLRTLYGIAPSKDELILTVIDRRLHRIGREALQTLDTETRALDRLRTYLVATNRALQPATATFARDFAKVPGARATSESHANYVVEITQSLLEEAIESGEIQSVETRPVAEVLGRLGTEFARPERARAVRMAPNDAAHTLLEIILAGLQRPERAITNVRER